MGTDYFVEQGGQITVQAPDQTLPIYNTVANGVLRSLTYQYYFKERRGLAIEPGTSNWTYEKLWFDDNRYVLMFNNNMGKILVECNDQNDAMASIKMDGVNKAVTRLSYLAQKLANPDTPASEITPNELSLAANDIHSTLQNGIITYATSQNTKLNAKLSNFQSMAHQYGWFMAGSSYWCISWINQEVRDAMYSGIYYENPDYDHSEIAAWTAWQDDFKAVTARIDNYIKTGYTDRKGYDSDIARSSMVINDQDNANDLNKEIFDLRDKINSFIPGNFVPYALEKLSSKDPIAAISDFGDYIIVAAWGAAATLGLASLASDNHFISFLLYSVFLPLLLYGITLAYYLPAIPFLRWISALAGWVILIVEALIAAPLWIAAHALPEGEGAAGQHGRRGYMLLLGIVIRPPLMVAGFFCAIILMNIMGRLIGSGFQLFIDGVSQTKTLGVTGTISMMVILGTTVIMLANKFFGLIHYIPEHVTNWIGQQMHSLGEKEDQSGAKGVFVGSTDAVSGLRGLSGVKLNKKANAESVQPQGGASTSSITPAQSKASEKNLS